MFKRKHFITVLWLGIGWLFLNGSAWAATSAYYKQPLTSPAQISSVNGTLEATISMDYNIAPKNNPNWKGHNPKNSAANATSTIGPDVVSLRNYTVQNVKQGNFTFTKQGATFQKPVFGTKSTWVTNIIGPTLRVQPGDTIKIHLINNLPDDRGTDYISGKASCIGSSDVSKASCNMTNFHTHGLHDSPKTVLKNSSLPLESGPKLTDLHFWIGDDVIDSLLPGGKQWDILIKIPDNHPAGTFWYHPHQHGTTSVQLASGLEGAIIIDDKSSAKSKGLDKILDEAGVTTDRLLMLQHIPYEAAVSVKAPDGTKTPTPCVKTTPCEVGWKVNGSQDANFNGQVFTGYTLVNGQTYPKIEMTTGAIERWRLINGGVAEPVSLSIVQLSKTGKSALSKQLDTLTAPNRKPFNKGVRIGKNAKTNTVSDLKTWLMTSSNFAANGKGKIATVPLNIIAYDGITTGRIESPACDTFVGKFDDCITLAPGNRIDALIQPPEAGTYLLLKGVNSAFLTNTGATSADDIVAVLSVTGNDKKTSLPDKKLLMAYAERQLYSPSSNIAKKKPDISYEAHFLFYPVKDGPVPGNSKDSGLGNISFGMAFSKPPARGTYDPSDLDYEEFTENMEPILLTQDQLGEWTIKVEDNGKVQSAHPFHIHTNPFYIKEIQTCTKTVTGAKANYTSKYTDCTSTKPMRWQDTLLVHPNQIATIRYQPRDFEGSFVFHCHFVDHEDSGMMRWVKICKEDNKACREDETWGLLPSFTNQDL